MPSVAPSLTINHALASRMPGHLADCQLEPLTVRTV